LTGPGGGIATVVVNVEEEKEEEGGAGGVREEEDLSTLYNPTPIDKHKALSRRAAPVPRNSPALQPHICAYACMAIP